MSTKIQAAGFILFARSPTIQFLLMRHHDRWDLPKGHVEDGESLQAAALRETEEETGIDAALIVTDPDFKFEIEYYMHSANRGSYDKRVTYFLGYLSNVLPVKVSEHTAYRWWTWPADEPIQAQTIDPLLQAVKKHFETFPDRLENSTTTDSANLSD